MVSVVMPPPIVAVLQSGAMRIELSSGRSSTKTSAAKLCPQKSAPERKVNLVGAWARRLDDTSSSVFGDQDGQRRDFVVRRHDTT